jgi:imidazolonepropionase-like amidohydrolase
VTCSRSAVLLAALLASTTLAPGPSVEAKPSTDPVAREAKPSTDPVAREAKPSTDPVAREAKPSTDPTKGEPRCYVLRAARLWDGVAAVACGPAEILVRDGTIVALGARVEHPSGAPLIDLHDRTLTPGFIDCHVHVTLRPETQAQIFAQSPADKALLGAQALQILLSHGFTTVRDLMDADLHGYTTASLRRAVERGVIPGPRLIVAEHMISSRGGHGDASLLLAADTPASQLNLADGPDEIRRVVRTEISRGAQWIKFGASGGFSSPADDPSEVTYTREEMTTLVQTARALGVPATPHAYGDEAIRMAVEAGVRSIEHASLASAEVLRLVEQRGIYIVPTMSTVVRQARHAEDDAFWKAAGRPEYVRAKYRRYAPRILTCAHNLANSRVKVALGSDIGTYTYARNNAEEFAEMVANGFTPLRALQAGTSVAAELLAQGDIGVLAVGKSADIVAMPGNPFEDIHATERVDFVARGGVIYRRP